MKRLLSLLLIAPVYVAAGTNDPWDGKSYHQNSSSQKNVASDLMRHLPLTDHAAILDVGCGDGNITAGLARKTTEHVLGIDVSRSMIDCAIRHS